MIVDLSFMVSNQGSCRYFQIQFEQPLKFCFEKIQNFDVTFSKLIFADVLLIGLTYKKKDRSVVNGVYHNGRVAAFGQGETGSNPGEDRYIV